MRLRNHQSDFRRHRQLFRAGVVAASEFEEHRFSVEHASIELVLLYRQQGIRWQQDLDRLKTTLSELDSKERRLGEEKEIYTIRAPAGGSLQLVEGLYPGAFLNQGEEVARFSPDSGLYAKIWISPARIGLIREGMRVRLHVDAFNYQQWGIITGNVVRISEDVTPARDGAPFFEIMCSLDKRALVLENGYKGELRKGMSVRARLLVAERTLFQLFYDSIENWLNPYGQDKG